MQSAPKKPSFKTPSFSVPKKTSSPIKCIPEDRTCRAEDHEVPSKSLDSNLPTQAGDNPDNSGQKPPKKITTKKKESKSSGFSVKQVPQMSGTGDGEKINKTEKKASKEKDKQRKSDEKKKKKVKAVEKVAEPKEDKEVKSIESEEKTTSAASTIKVPELDNDQVTEGASLKTTLPDEKATVVSSGYKVAEPNEETEVISLESAQKSEEKTTSAADTIKVPELDNNQVTEAASLKTTLPEENAALVSSGNKESCTQKKPDIAATSKKSVTLPVRSLTDEEYDAIFTSAIQRVLDINMDEWTPKLTSPRKLKRKTLREKCCITVGKKVQNDAKEIKDVQKGQIHKVQKKTVKKANKIISNSESNDKELKKIVDTDDKKEEHTGVEEAHVDENNNASSDVGEEPKPLDVEEVASVRDGENVSSERDVEDTASVRDVEDAASVRDVEDAASVRDVEDAASVRDEDDAASVRDVEDAASVRDEDDAASVNSQNQPVIEEEREAGLQNKNESTPARNVVISEELPDSGCNSPPQKKKKKVKKEKQLEPKKLQYTKNPEKEEKKLNEKILKLKKICKESKLSDGNSKKTGLDRKRKNKNVLKEKEATTTTSKCGKKIKRKKLMQQRDLEYDGTWVQCGQCSKWRHLFDVQDPSLLPEKWTCDMNTNDLYNSCEKREETYDESEHIYTQFTEGSVVWAKMAGYPWWPAMVEIDPDSQSYVDVDPEDAMTPTHYHTVFFDESVSRAWIRATFLKKFTGDQQEDGILKVSRKAVKYVKEISAAKKNACSALKCDIMERIKTFGFAARFKGPWGKQIPLEEKDIVPFSAGTSEVKKSIIRKRSEESMSSVRNDDEAVLDETTMDEVMDNTDSLLDNVESLLESLDDQLNEDEPDSPEIMPAKKKRKIVSPKEVVSPDDKVEQSNDNMDLRDITKATTDIDESENTVVKSLKYDSEQFATEMSDGEIEENDNTANKCSATSNNAQNVSTIHQMEKEISKIDQKKKTSKPAKTLPSVTTDKSDKPVEDSKSLVNDQRLSDTVVDKETVKIKKEITETQKTANGGIDDSRRETHKEESDEDMDLEIEKVENADSDTKDEEAEELEMCIEEDSLVPDVSNDMPDKAGSRNEASLHEEEDDFDLVEHSLYETREELENKVPDTLVTVLPNSMVDTAEDSDPFDLMEE